MAYSINPNDNLETYLKYADTNLEKIRRRVRECNNKNILDLSSEFRKSIYAISNTLENGKLSDPETKKLRNKLLKLEDRFLGLGVDFEAYCSCHKK